MNLLNRIIHLIRPARTTTLPNETGNIATVQVQHNPFETRNLSVLQQVGFASSLPLNTDVITAQVGGDNSNGVVLGSNNQQFRPKGMSAGESQMYDCLTPQQYIWLTSAGTVAIFGNNTVVLGFTSNPNCEITMSVGGEINLTVGTTTLSVVGSRVTVANNTGGSPQPVKLADNSASTMLFAM